MDTKKSLLIAAIAVALAGCQSFGGQPKEVEATMTLSEAICTLQNALIETKRSKETQAGLKVGDATAELSIGFKKVSSIEAGAKLTLGIVEWGPKASHSRERTSGNKLTVKFVPSDAGPYRIHVDGDDPKAMEHALQALAEIETKSTETKEQEAEKVVLPDCSVFAEKPKEQ